MVLMIPDQTPASCWCRHLHFTTNFQTVALWRHQWQRFVATPVLTTWTEFRTAPLVGSHLWSQNLVLPQAWKFAKFDGSWSSFPLFLLPVEPPLQSLHWTKRGSEIETATAACFSATACTATAQDLDSFGFERPQLCYDSVSCLVVPGTNCAWPRVRAEPGIQPASGWTPSKPNSKGNTSHMHAFDCGTFRWWSWTTRTIDQKLCSPTSWHGPKGFFLTPSAPFRRGTLLSIVCFCFAETCP